MRVASASPVELLEPYGPVGRSAWLDVDWRAHQRWVTLSTGPVQVVEIGPADGDPMIFVHGLSGSWQNWLENLPAMAAAGYRCIAPDLPGFGASPMPTGDERISITGYARCVDELMSVLGVDAAVVVGNSMGGFVAAELAIRFPARVQRLVLVAAAGISVEHQRNDRVMALLRRTERIIGIYGAWAASKSETVARRRKLRHSVFAIVAAHPAKLPAPLVFENLRGSGKPGLVDAIEALTSYPIRERLGEIACPTLVVWGTKDRLVPVKDATIFAQLIPDARKVVWDDTGHVPQMERPRAFNALVNAFAQEAPNVDVSPAAFGGT